MKITLQQLYDDTREKFQLKLLSGKEGMMNEVTRMYYMEDIMISNWTRQGELIVTTAMMSPIENDWLNKFIESIKSFEPSGVIINVGGYIEVIPEEIIAYCDEIKLPLLTFPWEMFLQDLQQDFTNRIFKSVQRESNITNAFLNAIFTPENLTEYVSCLEQNEYDKYDKYAVTVISSEMNLQNRMLNRRLQEMSCKAVLIARETDIIIVFCGGNSEEIKEDLLNFLENSTQFISKYDLWIGVGSIVQHYGQLHISYKKAKDCILFGKKKSQQLTIFEQLGLENLLMTCDPDLMKMYVEKKLGTILEYDKNNQTEYLQTLRTFVQYGGNTAETAKQLYVHRNTINYRMKKIKEMLGTEFAEVKDIVEYQISFYIFDLI
ncbi:MAG: PucR family transcriptional regulator [Lachnotalea sp.]